MNRILVVEDDMIIAADIEETLGRLGYVVNAVVDTGELALAEVARATPDLVLMDVKIRGPLDGIATVERLRSTSDVPVVYLTSHSDDATVVRASETAPHGYLVKPFNERDLRTTIEVALRKHELERHVARRERWFSTTLASLGDAIIATDPDDCITFMNPVAESLTGFTVERARGRKLSEVLRLVDDAGKALESPVGRAIRDRFAVTIPPDTRIVRDGETRFVSDAATAIVDDRGALLGGVIVFRDVTEQRALAERVARAERMASVGTMAAGIAHEVNNPLASIVGNIAFVQDELAAVRGALGAAADAIGKLEECSAALADAARSAERVRKIVQTMRWFSNRVSSEHRVVDVPAVIEGVLELSENTLRHKARLIRAYGTTPLVDVDETQLSQVLTNLLVNAADAIVDGRQAENEIRIATRTDDAGRAVIEVHDTGKGISKSERPRIFDPFFTTKGVGTGMGLGLAICHAFITSAGGEIDVESRPGATAFRVALPPARMPTVTKPETPKPPRIAQARVLILDDDPMVANAVARVLREHEVVVELDGNAALSRIASGERFDVFFCDLMMPNIGGMEVYDALTVANPELAARMVFLTGGAVSQETTSFLAKTQARVIYKPFDPALLKALVVELGSPPHA